MEIILYIIGVIWALWLIMRIWLAIEDRNIIQTEKLVNIWLPLLLFYFGILINYDKILNWIVK